MYSRFLRFLKLSGSMVLVGILLSGCGLEPVKPWERDILSAKKMQLISLPLNAYLDDHIYYSKESSSGGAGVGGGGCGCN